MRTWIADRNLSHLPPYSAITQIRLYTSQSAHIYSNIFWNNSKSVFCFFTNFTPPDFCKSRAGNSVLTYRNGKQRIRSHSLFPVFMLRNRAGSVTGQRLMTCPLLHLRSIKNQICQQNMHPVLQSSPAPVPYCRGTLRSLHCHFPIQNRM